MNESKGGRDQRVFYDEVEDATPGQDEGEQIGAGMEWPYKKGPKSKTHKKSKPA